jgi:type 1 glutamine amidotransferase
MSHGEVPIAVRTRRHVMKGFDMRSTSVAQRLIGACAFGWIAAAAFGVVAQQPPPPPAGQGRGPQGAGAPDPCGGRSMQPQMPCASDVERMMEVLPVKAPATPKQPRRVLVYGHAAGYQHSSIPLAARTIEEMGKKTGAWTTTITYDPAAMTAENLKQYDAIFLSSTTGTFLDDPKSETLTAARRKAFIDFVRGGKGLAGIHAAGDSYHGGGARATGAPQRGGGRATVPACSAAPGGGAGGAPLWPEFNKMIGGYFKFHWVYPTPITVKIDDPKSPINAAFKGKSFNTIDEVYTFNQDSWSRENVHVLTSIDYSLMTDCEKGLEASPRTDRDFGLSWIRREGNGRVFYEALGHSETIYYNNPAMLEHILAGMQYALGDLAADDGPSVKSKKSND